MAKKLKKPVYDNDEVIKIYSNVKQTSPSKPLSEKAKSRQKLYDKAYSYGQQEKRK